MLPFDALSAAMATGNAGDIAAALVRRRAGGCVLVALVVALVAIRLRRNPKALLARSALTALFANLLTPIQRALHTLLGDGSPLPPQTLEGVTREWVSYHLRMVGLCACPRAHARACRPRARAGDGSARQRRSEGGGFGAARERGGDRRECPCGERHARRGDP